MSKENHVIFSPLVKNIAYAIAVAERGHDEIESGKIVRNNPGDIEDRTGVIITYPTLDEGWYALYHQVALMFAGSHVYNPEMTLDQIAEKYVGTNDAPNWAKNVATLLDTTSNTKLKDIRIT